MARGNETTMISILCDEFSIEWQSFFIRINSISSTMNVTYTPDICPRRKLVTTELIPPVDQHGYVDRRSFFSRFAELIYSCVFLAACFSKGSLEVNGRRGPVRRRSVISSPVIDHSSLSMASQTRYLLEHRRPTGY